MFPKCCYGDAYDLDYIDTNYIKKKYFALNNCNIYMYTLTDLLSTTLVCKFCYVLYHDDVPLRN